jgi:redox-sensitive bicupin YhaK (pirin superfamily)
VRAAHEHAVIALDGALLVDGTALSPGALGYRGVGRDELVLEATAPVRVLLLGGVPFAERIVMWWNFVGRDNDELAAADAAWRDHDARVGTVASPLPRVPAPTPPWLRATS